MGQAVTRVSVPECVVMSALNRRDGVDLDISQMLDRRQRGINGGASLFPREGVSERATPVFGLAQWRAIQSRP